MRSCIITLLVACGLACVAMAVPRSPQSTATVSHGDATWAVFEGGGWLLLGGDPVPAGEEQTLTTVVPDPDYPDQPWTVTTPRKPKEPMDVFIRRHNQLVEAVRDFLDRREP